LKVLIGCEFSQIVTKAFRDRGHEAYSCDLDPTDGNPEWHIQGDLLKIMNDGSWDLGIFFPPCTYLTVTGNKWLKDQPKRKSGALVGAERRKAQKKAVDFFMKLANAKIPRICIENPVGVMSTRWRKPDQIICPTQFGHPEPKKTCLWLKGLPVLIPTKKVEPDYYFTKSGKRLAKWYYLLPKTPERQKIRNTTFQGIADAFADQWR